MSFEKKYLWWFVGSSFIFAIMGALIKYASYIDSFKTTIFRFSIGMALLGTLAVMGKIKLDFNKPRLLVCRGITGGIAVFVYVWSISNIGLAKGTIISNTSTIFATILSVIILKERMTLLKAIFIVMALYGLYLLVGTNIFSAGRMGIYDLVAIVGAFFSGIADVTIRKARQTESTYSVFFAQCVMGFWIVLVPANLIPAKIGIEGAVILLLIGITAAVGQLMTTYAYKFIPLSTGSVMSMLTPVCNLIIGTTVFKESFTGRGFTGVFIVLVSCYMVIMSDDFNRKILRLFSLYDRTKTSE